MRRPLNHFALLSQTRHPPTHPPVCAHASPPPPRGPILIADYINKCRLAVGAEASSGGEEEEEEAVGWGNGEEAAAEVEEDSDDPEVRGCCH